ncbi:MAG: hypothetical protein WDO17_25935 [Alphaproteobacteria bacterium]
MASVYVETSGKLTTNSTTFVPMPGLAIQLPEGVGDMAIVTLNLPQPYAEGNDYPGGVFRIRVDGKIYPIEASFSYGTQNANNRMPTTLVVGVWLQQKKQTVEAMWHNVRGCTVIIDSPCTLSAIY